MKVGLCLSSAPSYSETFIRSKIKGLLDAGLDVKVFLFNRSTSSDDIKYHNPFPLKFPLVILSFLFVLISLILLQPLTAIRFIRLEREDGKNVIKILKSLYINAHILMHGRGLDWVHFSFATVAIEHENIALAMKARLAVSLRGFDISLYPLMHPGCYEKLWKRVDKVHTISDDLYDAALKNGLLSHIDFQKIRPAIHTTNLLKKEILGEIQQPVRMLSVGRLEWKKGFIYAIQAVAHLIKSGIGVTYQIAGVGSSEQELRYMIRDLKLENHVKLLGKISHDQIFLLMKDSDIYVQPSVQEGFCNALIEAQGTGLLCIATNAEGLTENIIDGQTGWIVPKRDPLAIASRVEEIIVMNQEERTKIAQNAIGRIAEQFKIERLVAELKLFYTEK